MLPAAKMNDNHVCPALSPPGDHGAPRKPYVGGQVLFPCAPSVLIAKDPAAHLADYAGCQGDLDMIAGGASTVLIRGLPATRLGDATIHRGAIIGPGAPTVLIGGPAFALPSTFTIDGSPDFRNKVIRDLYLLSTTPSGRELFRRLVASGKTVRFIPTADDNGYCSPVSSPAALAGVPTSSVIQYNPEHAMGKRDAAGNAIPGPPQVTLAHEMCHALANAEGRHQSGIDSKGPPSEPTIEEEEAQAIGVGSHRRDYPSENSVRADLGLPERADHGGGGKSPEPSSLRPGGY